MTFLLAELLEGVTDTSSVDTIDLVGVNADSRAIVEGEVFFALPGVNVHGDSFAADVVKAGAVAMVTDRAPANDPGIPVVVVEDVRRAYAKAVGRIYGPQPRHCVGITGTNGKTSVASFVRQIWQANDIRAAAIGTLGVDINGKVATGELTTPDPLLLHQGIAEIKAAGTEHVIMEASSHGLDQRRLDGLTFDIVGFSNLSRDHLDYHEDEDAYREAKLRLFKDLLKDGGMAVVNSDDEEHMPFMFAALDRGATLLTVGTEGAYFEISTVEREGWGQRVTGKLVGEFVEFLLPLAGRFQVDNAVMATALAIQSGADSDTTIEALNSIVGPKGRMELVAQPNGGAIFIDYSHTPDALQLALEALRPYTEGALTVVFGCGGDRDTGKRPLMGEIANKLADKVIVTDDNPRTENAEAIRAEILKAVPNGREISGRAEAIRTAVAELQTGDVLLIAGKGHEEYQVIGNDSFHFSDHEVVAEALKG